MTSQGANFPDSCVDDAGTGTVAWANPENATASDGVYAQFSFNAADVMSHYLWATDFDFAIPDDAVIDGVVVQVSTYAQHDTANQHTTSEIVSLLKGGVITGDNKAGATYWPSRAASDAQHGGISDGWNASLTPADINAVDFGVVVAAEGDDALGTGSWGKVDYIKIIIYYTLPVGAIMTTRTKYWGDI